MNDQNPMTEHLLKLAEKLSAHAENPNLEPYLNIKLLYMLVEETLKSAEELADDSTMEVIKEYLIPFLKETLQLIKDSITYGPQDYLSKGHMGAGFKEYKVLSNELLKKIPLDKRFQVKQDISKKEGISSENTSQEHIQRSLASMDKVKAVLSDKIAEMETSEDDFVTLKLSGYPNTIKIQYNKITSFGVSQVRKHTKVRLPDKTTPMLITGPLQIQVNIKTINGSYEGEIESGFEPEFVDSFLKYPAFLLGKNKTLGGDKFNN